MILNKIALIIGVASVIMALIFYTITIFLNHRKKIVTRKMIITQGLGLSLDIIGTTAMFMIRPGISLSFHGIIGFVALTLMIVEFGLLTRFKEEGISKNFLLYSKVAYIIWLIVFFYGVLM
jgi:uncharacterized repeat protein (TIGR03987 family)